MSLHNFNSNTKSWKMYTNTLTSISGDDLLVAPSYGKDLILEVSANNDIFFKKGEITKRFDNLVSDYLDMSFVREASFNSLNSQVEYILQEISGSSVLNFITSGISSDLLIKSYDGRDIVLEVSGNSEIIFKRGDISYNLDDLIGGGGGFSQSSDYATYNILDITGKIIFTDNSTNVQYYNDASLNNVDISGSLKVAGSISAPNIYTKSEIDASFTNVYTKNQVYTKTEIDASLANIYTKNQVYSKTEIDASLANVYTNSLDVSGNVTFRGSTLYVPSVFTIDPNGHGDNTGSVLINGNLVVQGVTTTINSSVVDISDKILVLASNATNSLHADGAGFEISGAKVNLLYNNSSNTFRTSIGMSISGNVVPSSNGVGSLGETGKIWDIAYIRELNVTNFITSGISSDLLIKSYDGRDIVLEVSGNSEIIFKRGDISYNLDELIGGGGGGLQSSDYATYDILDITGKIIFTDNSTNVQYYNDASLNNVDISGSLKVAGSISAPNIYTKTEIDNSFTNVYTKNQVYSKTEIDNSFTNVYTKNQVYSKTEIDTSFSNVYTKNLVYSKTEIDVSLANVYTKNQVYNKTEIDASFTNVYTINQIDVSFVSKQLFETSYNVLLSSIGSSGGSGTSSIAKKFYNQDWNLQGIHITKIKDISGTIPSPIGFTPDGKTIVIVFNRSTFYTLPNGQQQLKPSLAVYDLISNSWTQRGQTISNEFVNVPSWVYEEQNPDRYINYIITRAGWNIVPNAINSTGTKIAFINNQQMYGTSNNSYLGYKTTCNIYEYIGTQWIKQVEQNFNIEQGLGSGLYITLGGPNIKLFNFRNDGNNELTIYTLINGIFVIDSVQISKATIDNALPEIGYAIGKNFSNDGTIILLQRYYNYAVFKYNGTTWIQYGLVLEIPTWSDIYAPRCNISDDGNTIMAGHFLMTVNEDRDAGMVKVFKYNDASNNWFQAGQDIVYEEISSVNEANYFVYGSDALCLSGDGSTVLVGTRTRPNASHTGTIQAYRYSNVSNYWSKIGRTMTGMSRAGQFAKINYNGDVIALDEEGYQETSTSLFNTGRIRVYEIEV